MDQIIDMPTTSVILTVLALILADTALGIIVAAKRDELRVEISKLPQFLMTGVFPYIGALIILAGLAEFVPLGVDEMRAIFYGSAALVVAKYLADIKRKVDFVIKPKPPDEPPTAI